MLLLIKENDENRFYSTMNEINKIYSEINKISPTISVLSKDNNGDLKKDIFNFKISFNADTQNLKDIKLIIIFNYNLEKSLHYNYNTDTMLYLHINNYQGISEVKAIGSLNLVQKSPLKTIIDDNLNDDFFTYNSNQSYDFLSVYEKFNSNEISTEYNHKKIIYPFKSTKEVELDIIIEIPSYQEVDYISNSLYSLKRAWVQYFCTFLPISVIIYLAIQYTYNTKILNSVEYINGEKISNNEGLAKD